jgi:putative transposase
MLPGNTYHLFNHANGWENLFAEPKNYDFFLGRLSLHVLPVAHIYAYCLMPNHFHLLIKIKDESELEAYFSQKEETGTTELSDNKLQAPKSPQDIIWLNKKVSKSFSNLFNSYTQAFNKMYNRMGSLFMQNMKREEVCTDGDFCRVVHYIHANPVHHKFVKGVDKWSYSSYNTFLSQAPTKIERDYVLQVFGGLDWFIKYHQQPIDPKNKWFDI